MFSSTTTVGEYSILECPPMSSLLMTKTTTPTKWKCNTATATTAEIAPNCPRCASSNTKFCYYNNYSLSQPRYFCKGCRRYWTKGGSLRNVPVGGGCRKSRRARAAARKSGVQSYLGSTSSPVSGGSSANESETGADIDLAAVFANYVNQNVDNNKEFSSPGASSGSSENFPALEDDAMFEYQKEVDLINDEGFDQMQQVLVPDQISMHEDINGQEFASGVFEMQHDELAADMLWLDSTDLQDFGSENGSTVQIQDFGLFSPDDNQLSVSANLVTDNWGSFDLSAYELFSRPS